jgi:hypothetical protein
MEAKIQNPEWILSLGRGFSFFSTSVEVSANKRIYVNLLIAIVL